MIIALLLNKKDLKIYHPDKLEAIDLRFSKDLGIYKGELKKSKFDKKFEVNLYEIIKTTTSIYFHTPPITLHGEL
jgi:hypothetical protein